MPDPQNKMIFLEGEETVPDVDASQISDAHYAAIGKVSDAWADLEFEIDRLIWRLMQTPQQFGACVTAQLTSIHPRMNALRALVGLWNLSASSQKKLSTWHGEVAAMADTRNRLIHDKRYISYHSDDIIRFQITAKTKMKFEPLVELIDDLERFRLSIVKKIIEFHQIDELITHELTSFPKKRIARLPQIEQA